MKRNMGTRKNRLFFLVSTRFPALRAAKHAFFSGSSLKAGIFRDARIKPGLLALLALICAGCSGKQSPEGPAGNFYAGALRSERSAVAASIPAAQAETAADDGAPPEGEAQFAGAAERKLVKRAQLRVRVEDLAAADASVNALMERYGAYAASTEIEENSRAYLIRVPHESYGAVLSAAGGMGRTLYRSESAEDVSLRYYDLAGRLATKRELLKTFQSYLGKAKNIEEILSVETRIAELQNEIDGTGKELRSLANLVDFATVALDLYGPVAASRYTGPTLGERIKELFGGFGDFVFTVLVVLTGAVIYGIPLLLLLALLFWLCFGRIGLIRKLWCAAAGRQRADQPKNETP